MAIGETGAVGVLLPPDVRACPIVFSIIVTTHIRTLSDKPDNASVKLTRALVTIRKAIAIIGPRVRGHVARPTVTIAINCQFVMLSNTVCTGARISLTVCFVTSTTAVLIGDAFMRITASCSFRILRS
jgi:hypothetical protein